MNQPKEEQAPSLPAEPWNVMSRERYRQLVEEQQKQK